MPRDTQGVEDWAAVGDAIRKRMRELKISTAKLARETGLSETTIRYIGQSASGHHKSALVAISAVLRWRYDHLVNILHGEPHKNAPPGTQTETRLERVLHAEMAGLKNVVHGIDRKVDVLLTSQRPGDGRKP